LPPESRKAPLVVPTSSVVRVADIWFLLSIESNSDYKTAVLSSKASTGRLLSEMTTIYIDADACPVKQEVYRVAERHARKGVVPNVFVVSNSRIAVPCALSARGWADYRPCER
jgi:hypothetical protein